MKSQVAGITVFTVLFGVGRSEADMLYSVTDLGFRGELHINANEQVIGSDSQNSGVLWQDGVLTYLPVLPGTSGNEPFGINDNGQIVGRTWSLPRTPLLWDSGTVTDFLPGYVGSAYDISNDGKVVGWYTNGAVSTEAFVWDNGTFSGLGTFGGESSVAMAVSSTGQAIGQIRDLNQWFLWDSGTVTIYDDPGAIVQDINDGGQVVGQTSRSGTVNQAYVWLDGQTTLLGTLLPNDQSVAWAINNGGLIVGESYRFGSDDAILWKDGELLNLNDLLLNSGWHLEKAVDINDDGYIVGRGINPNGERSGFLLTPVSGPSAVPEPSTVAMFLGFGGMGLIAAYRRRNRTA